MSHDKHTIHVSHYDRSPTWRSAVAPEDRGWLLFIDVTGAPHLYLATEVQDNEGATVTTYAPCVRAMLRDADVSPAPAATHFAISVAPVTGPPGAPSYLASSGDLSAAGSSPRGAVSGLLAFLPGSPDDAPAESATAPRQAEADGGKRVQSANGVPVGPFTVRVTTDGDSPGFRYIACSDATRHPNVSYGGKTAQAAVARCLLHIEGSSVAPPEPHDALGEGVAVLAL